MEHYRRWKYKRPSCHCALPHQTQSLPKGFQKHWTAFEGQV